MTHTLTLEDRGFQLATMVGDLSSVDWAITKAIATCNDKDAVHALTLALVTLNNVGREMDVIAGAFGATRSGAFDLQDAPDLAAV